MRILIISDAPWRDDNSLGNTLSFIFRSMENVEFANLYCKSGNPDNDVVKKYYQITEKNVLLRKGGIESDNNLSSPAAMAELNRREQKIYNVARKLRFQSLFLIRELIWKIGKWKTKSLDDFLDGFAPDVIFSFCLESTYYMNLIEYCRTRTGAKLALLFADDIYAYLNKSPLYLIYKFFNRKRILVMGKRADLAYGISQMLCNEYSLLFGRDVVPLNKICEKIPQIKEEINLPLKITYAGNLFYGRWETLALLAKAIEEINRKSKALQLDIFTTGLITKNMKKALNIQDSSWIRGALTYPEVEKTLRRSDLVLHVESFKKKEIRKTRLSFSTKIVDYMQSGVCILAIGPKEVASIRYLSDNDIALVVSDNDQDDIQRCLESILNNNEIIIRTARKMRQFSIEKHSVEVLRNNLYAPLEKLCSPAGDML